MYEEIKIQVIKKGRKNYRCVWCGDSIPIGLEHLYRVYRFDGEFQTDRVHGECIKASKDCEDLEEGFEAWTFVRGTCNLKGHVR